MCDQISGPCGLNLSNYNTVVISQKGKNKCKCKKECSCKVFLFNVVGTGGTGSVASSNSTFAEQFDPTPMHENQLFDFNFIPSSLQDNRQSSGGNIWINTLTGKIYKLFPNGYWYLQGNIRKGYNNVFSVTSDERKNITLGETLRFNFSPKEGIYSVNLKLHFEQDARSNNIIEINVYDGEKLLETNVKPFESLVDSIILPMNLTLKENSDFNVKLTVVQQQYQMNNLWLTNSKIDGFLIN